MSGQSACSAMASAASQAADRRRFMGTVLFALQVPSVEINRLAAVLFIHLALRLHRRRAPRILIAPASSPAATHAFRLHLARGRGAAVAFGSRSTHPGPT